MVVLLRALSCALALAASAAALCQPAAPVPARAPARIPPPTLPPPSTNPLGIDLSTDPILQLARSQTSPDQFRALIGAAVVHHPGTLEAEAQTAEARAVVGEANERRLPSVDLSINSTHSISRRFGTLTQTLIERSQPANRTDAVLSVSQTLFDFGAGSNRVSAAGARLRAAAADAEANADQIALNSVAAWYDVFAYRALVELSDSFVKNQEELRAAVEERIRQGVSAPGDTARVDSYLASAETRLAGFRRQRANAEARFTELMGGPAPAQLERAPVALLPAMSKDAASLAAMSAPLPRAAQAVADAARKEAKAIRADRMPQIGATLDANRYGVIENTTDYDIRGRLTLRQHLFGGTEARLAQADARARSADAHAARIRDEAARDASIAWSDVQALDEQLRATEASYIASRRSRDVLVERFVNARGSLFDVVAAEDSYFETATAYIRALSELDAARYVLLSRTGGLLAALGIDPASVGGRRD
ncbi:MAG: outer membrane protein adhesin transport system [Sphingomonadales bacterium]|jgi:adhesin transport system outer membrane protein|nr:outer membrane protein adhesin transport system [Sphingomonadales bacterium]